jgi:dGTPase
MVNEGYTEYDRERFIIDPSKRPERSEFARDRARIIHSFALRRLAAKTQVAVPWADDFPRTRLSHSLECAQVGREIGSALGADPDLMDTACLAHDLGHPPFGHNGERALDEIAGACGGFEGNAQSFRILSRLESKTRDGSGTSIGLNLTRASLDAATKYPWRREKGNPKFGVYDDDLKIFEWVRKGAPTRQTAIEAQIMDWSDDVAYSVHDLEDGIVTGKILISSIKKFDSEIATTVRERFVTDASDAEIEAAMSSITSLPLWPKDFDLTHGDLSKLKNLTSDLISRFAKAAEGATRERYGAGELIRYHASLVIPRQSRIEVAFLKAIADLFIISAESSRSRYAEQREMLKGLVERLMQDAPKNLETFFLEEWSSASGDGAKLRVVVDQVASLTDLGAIRMAKRLGIPALKSED